MSSSFYWIKLFHEILDDPKMGRLNDRLWRRSIELFLLAGETGRDGSLPAIGDISWRLRSGEAELLADLDSLVQVGILMQPEPGCYRVVNFEKRQAPMSDLERKRRQRSRDRSSSLDGHSAVTGRDAESESDSDLEADSDIHNPPPKRQASRSAPAPAAAAIQEEEFSPAVLDALRSAGVFTHLWNEVFSSGLSDADLLALSRWALDSGSETPGALFINRLRHREPIPQRYLAPACRSCGGLAGQHSSECTARYVNGALSHLIQH